MAEQPDSIVIGVDDSDEARAALRWAIAHAGPDARLTAVRAWSDPTTMAISTPALVVLPDPRVFEEAAELELARVLDGAGATGITSVVRKGHAGDVLAEEAAGAGLVVVGHRGQGRMSLMLGSTANFVLHHVECPVVVVRGESPGVAREVVVGLDPHGDDESHDPRAVRALQWAYRLPGVERIRVVHAWATPWMAIDTYDGLPTGKVEHEVIAENAVLRVLAAAGEAPAGVEVIREMAFEDSAARTLIKASETADLVVVGTRGRGGFASLVLGSTSTSVVAHSHSPVAVVP